MTRLSIMCCFHVLSIKCCPLCILCIKCSPRISVIFDPFVNYVLVNHLARSLYQPRIQSSYWRGVPLRTDSRSDGRTVGHTRRDCGGRGGEAALGRSGGVGRRCSGGLRSGEAVLGRSGGVGRCCIACNAEVRCRGVLLLLIKFLG